MLLAVDVGNTNVVAGVFDARGDLRAHWRWASDTSRTADEYAALLAAAGLKLSRIIPTRSPFSIVEGVRA